MLDHRFLFDGQRGDRGRAEFLLSPPADGLTRTPSSRQNVRVDLK